MRKIIKKSLLLKAKSYKLKADGGITIYLAMLVMGGALAVALSVSTLMVGEFKISGETVNSLKAVYVADSAMEYALYQARPAGTYATPPSELTTSWGTVDTSTPVSHSSCPPGLSSDAVCEIEIMLIATSTSSVVSCSSSSAPDCIKVVARGSIGGINRALEIVYPNL